MKEKREDIINYLKEIAASDNRGTADPFYYTIQTEKEVSVPLDASEYIVYRSEELCKNFTSKEAYIAYLDEHDYDQERIDEMIQQEDLFKIGMAKVWEEKGMFLTEEEAKRHLKVNHYHYSKNASTFVKHAWRAPKMQAFFKNLFEYFEVEEKK